MNRALFTTEPVSVREKKPEDGLIVIAFCRYGMEDQFYAFPAYLQRGLWYCATARRPVPDMMPVTHFAVGLSSMKAGGNVVPLNGVA